MLALTRFGTTLPFPYVPMQEIRYAMSVCASSSQLCALCGSCIPKARESPFVPVCHSFESPEPESRQYTYCCPFLFESASVVPDSSFGLCCILLCLLLSLSLLVSLSLLLFPHSLVVSSLLFCSSRYLDSQSSGDQAVGYGVCLLRAALGGGGRGWRGARRRSAAAGGWCNATAGW